MTKIDSALWRDMMDYLRRKHAPICRQWFEELQPLGLDSGLLQIYTASSVQQNYLQRKCVEQFTEAAQAASGALIAVRFVATREGLPEPAGKPAPVGTELAVPVAAERAAPVALQASYAPVAPLREHHTPHAPPARPAPIPVARPAASAAEHWHDQIVISPDYSFDQFVPGPGNQLAYAAARAVANQPGTAYNPLFIHGGVGLGKTHLLQAICQTIIHQRPDMRICYLPCDAFMNQFLDCVQQGKMSEFRHRYRHVDMLVLDDVHFLANRERTQEEFFHTFNELYQSQRQIVLSSDSPPSEIPQLEERLVSRFQWGLVANVTKPCYETRVAIVKAKSRLRGLELPEDVTAYIATRIDTNARELEGAITTVQGFATLQNRAIDLKMAQEALGEPTGDSRNSQVTLQNIIDAVTAFYNVKLSDLQSKRRHKSITGPRQVCMWLARRRTRFSLQEIGGYFGGRDHTTVMHSIQMVDDRMGADSTFTRQIEQLDQRIGKPVAT